MRSAFTRRLDADRRERAAESVRDVGSGIDERAVEIDGEQLDPGLRQHTLTAISAGAANKSSSSLSSLSMVNDAPAISSDVQ